MMVAQAKNRRWRECLDKKTAHAEKTILYDGIEKLAVGQART